MTKVVLGVGARCDCPEGCCDLCCPDRPPAVITTVDTSEVDFEEEDDE